MNDDPHRPAYCSDPLAHRELVARVSSGSALVDISPSIACQFYLRVNLADIRKQSGENEILAKFLVAGLLSAAYFLLIGLIILAVETEGWAAMLYVPIGGIIWSIFAGFINSSADFKYVTHGLACAVLITLIYYLVNPMLFLALIVFLYATSLLLHRLAYRAARHFLQQFVLKSCTAYEMLWDHIVVSDAPQADSEGP